MSNQKYQKGDRVKVLVGHRIWHFKEGMAGMEDIRPELKDDTATVEYTYGQMSEMDNRYSKGEDGYKSYSLKFDTYGSIAWFDEDDIIPTEN